MLVSCRKVCENVDELDEDPGVGFPDDVEPQPIITASLNLGLLNNDLSKPENLGIIKVFHVLQSSSPLECLRLNEVIDDPTGAVQLLSVLVQLLPHISSQAVELLVDLLRHF